MSGEPSKERVRATLRWLGGYWPPLAAVARMQEELGELAELLACASPDANEIASELADLWIITTAVADQFGGRVAEPGGDPHEAAGSAHEAAGSERALPELVAAAGRIARIVNYYAGPKTPRTLRDWVSLSEAVADLHRVLDDLAATHRLDLAEAVGAKLESVQTRDEGRFRELHDPSTARSLESFLPFYAQAAGVGAGVRDGRLRLWGSPEWSSASSESTLDAIARDLESFVKAAAFEGLAGYVVAGPTLDSGALFEEWLTALVGGLEDRDPRRAVRAARRTPRTDRLAFAGSELSVAAFSVHYEPPDPRHLPDGAFALLSLDQVAAAR